MSAITSSLEAVDWVADTLRADGTLDSLLPDGVWLGTVPRFGDDREIKVPAVVIEVISVEPTQVVGDFTSYYHVNLNVKVINLERDLTNSVTISNRIKTLLHQQSGTSENGTIRRCWEIGETPLYVEPFQADRYHHIGTIYRLFVQSSG